MIVHFYCAGCGVHYVEADPSTMFSLLFASTHRHCGVVQISEITGDSLGNEATDWLKNNA